MKMTQYPHQHTISPGRSQWQSATMVAICIPLLAGGLAFHSMHFWTYRQLSTLILLYGVSLGFALIVWRLRAATAGAAATGGLICAGLLWGTGRSVLHSAFPPLFTLFLLTFAATRLQRRAKQELGLAEPSTGRTASQVVANLGAAGLIAVLAPGTALWLTVCVAALTEATADTVSSELGQVYGGRPFLLTNFRRVPPGTDGAVSLAGTLAGVAGAAILLLVAAWSLPLAWREIWIAFAGGIAGLFADSLLGATVERRGWLGNDLVNFFSTILAALFAAVLYRSFQ